MHSLSAFKNVSRAFSHRERERDDTTLFPVRGEKSHRWLRPFARSCLERRKTSGIKARGTATYRYGLGYWVYQGAGREKGGVCECTHAHIEGTHWRTANSEFVRRLPTRTRRCRHTQSERQPNREGTPYHIDIHRYQSYGRERIVRGNGRGKAQPGSGGNPNREHGARRHRGHHH